jgi:hypothetical protein
MLAFWQQKFELYELPRVDPIAYKRMR